MNHPNEPEGRRGLAQARAALKAAGPRRRAATTVVDAAREQARAERPDRPAPEAVDLA